MVPFTLAQRLIEQNEGNPEFAGIGWAPHVCYLCKGTGEILSESDNTWVDFVGQSIVIEPGDSCPKCGGTGHGPQGKALLRPEFEMLVGGQRGGGKSEVGMIFLVSGNPDKPYYKVLADGTVVPNAVNISYVFHPGYKALVLRRNQKDLDDWIGKAAKLYHKLGGRAVGRPTEFVFDHSGAKIVTGHMADKDAYQQYQGQEYHRIVIEELTQIPSRQEYDMVRASCRVPESLRGDGIRPQILLTTNPGGVGHQWVRNYFRIQVPDESTGELYKPEETIEEEIYSTVAKRKIKRTRVFIPAGIADNPSLSDEYIANLEGIEDEKTKRAWLYGDWNVLAGIYFDNFRPNGPGFDEPVNADHVIQPGRNCETYPELEPWWPRVIACDWGYQHNSAVYWGCRNPDTKQVHIYRELVLNRTSPVDLGVAIAEHSLDDLNGLADNHMFMYLSHDAYSATQHAVRGQVRSIAELIMDGINRVLGDNSAHVPYMDMSDEEKTTDFHAHYEQWMSRVRQHRRRSITILHADTNRVLGFTNMRAMMNWNPPVSASYIDRDPDLERMIFREKGVVAGQHYQHLTTPQDDGLYPRLLVWAEGYQHGRRVGCPALIQAIPQAIHDEKRVEDVAKTHFEGLDSLDSCRYLLQGVKALEHVRMPPETERLQAISRFKASNPHYTFNDLCQINMTMEMKQKQQRQNQLNFRTPRRARALRHAINSQPSSKMIH